MPFCWNSWSRAGLSWAGFLHSLHSLRTSRWETSRLSPEDSNSGETPRSNKRMIAVALLSQCSVASTRWPVCAARRAISAVSSSRISPTQITSGSCRRMLRSDLAKVMPALGLISIWLASWQRGLDGIFDRNHVVRVAVDLVQHRIQGGGFPAPRRPAHQHHARRLADGAGRSRSVAGRECPGRPG